MNREINLVASPLKNRMAVKAQREKQDADFKSPCAIGAQTNSTGRLLSAPRILRCKDFCFILKLMKLCFGLRLLRKPVVETGNDAL